MKLTDRNKRDIISYGIILWLLVSFFISFIPTDTRLFKTISLFLSTLVGVNVVLSIYYFVSKLRFCIHTKIALIGVLIIQLLGFMDSNIRMYVLNEDELKEVYKVYCKWYDKLTTSLVLFSCLIYFLFKIKKMEK